LDFRMDVKSLSELLKGTIDPTVRNEAEKKLAEVHKIIGFGPVLLQVVMSNDVELPVRQAAVIYLKNMVCTRTCEDPKDEVSGSWVNREAETPGAPIPFSVHEQDRAVIRDNIVDAVVMAPDIIRIQLGVCVSQIVKHDFPERWPQIVDKVSLYLQNPDPAGWLGALLSLYQLVKNYEYKKADERGPLREAMNLLLPQLYGIITQLMPDPSQQSVAVQKQILKIYFALTQYVLPLDLITKEVFGQWMEVLRLITEADVPAHTLQVDEEERPQLIWWKRKKWALHTLTRLFERYGIARQRHERVQGVQRVVPENLLWRHIGGHVEEPGSVQAASIRLSQGDAAGLELHQHCRLPRPQLEADQAPHAADPAGHCLPTDVLQ